MSRPTLTDRLNLTSQIFSVIVFAASKEYFASGVEKKTREELEVSSILCYAPVVLEIFFPENLAYFEMNGFVDIFS